MSTIVDRAARRGEVPTGTDAAEAIQAVTAQLCYRLVRRRRATQSGDRRPRRGHRRRRPRRGAQRPPTIPVRTCPCATTASKPQNTPLGAVAGLADLGGGAEPNGGYFTEITDVPAPSPTIRRRHLDGAGCIIIHDRRATGIRASAAVAAHRVDDLAIGWPGNRS